MKDRIVELADVVTVAAVWEECSLIFSLNDTFSRYSRTISSLEEDVEAGEFSIFHFSRMCMMLLRKMLKHSDGTRSKIHRNTLVAVEIYNEILRT